MLHRLVISLPDQFVTHDPDSCPILGPGLLLLLILDYNSNSQLRDKRLARHPHLEQHFHFLSPLTFQGTHESCWLPGKVKREDKLKDLINPWVGKIPWRRRRK